MKFNTAPFRVSTTLQDSGPIAVAAGGYVTLLDPLVYGGEWFELRIRVSGGAGTVNIALGAAGAEVNIMHHSFSGGFDGDILNLAFQFPGGERLSIISTSNLASAEAHVYY